MRSNRKLYGGAVLSNGDRAYGMMELLTFHVRDRLDLVYYPHPYDIDVYASHDFIMVFSLKELREVVKFYTTHRQPIPLLVHVDALDVLHVMRHEYLFPGLKVLPIPRTLFGNGDPDVTLNLSVVNRIIASL